MYNKYDQKYVGVRAQQPPLATLAGKKKGAWGKIFGGSSSSSSSLAQTSATRAVAGGGGLATYLNSNKIWYQEQLDEF
jgi:hypothetical protein